MILAVLRHAVHAAKQPTTVLSVCPDSMECTVTNLVRSAAGMSVTKGRENAQLVFRDLMAVLVFRHVLRTVKTKYAPRILASVQIVLTVSLVRYAPPVRPDVSIQSATKHPEIVRNVSPDFTAIDVDKAVHLVVKTAYVPRIPEIVKDVIRGSTATNVTRCVL